MMKSLFATAVAIACSVALAKIPPPVLDDAAKAKAAETAAKAAWQTKVDNYLLCKAQDRVAAHYMKTSGKPMSKDAKGAAAPVTGKAPAAPAAAGPATAPAAAASGTPVATSSAPPAACIEAGPFAFNPPEQKPLETAGAHSPTGTAASPPSVRQESAKIAPTPAKK